jgi:hypothetical protein
VFLVYLVLLVKEVIQMETDALSELVACNLDWEFLAVLALQLKADTVNH